MTQVAIITGASSGMGFEAAQLFHQKGYEVYGGARHVDQMADLAKQDIHTSYLDVTNPQSNKDFVQTVLDEQGRIDVLVNSAGYGSGGALEDVPLQEAKNQFNVNLFGLSDLTNQVLPTMRFQHSGQIINISSIGGQMYSQLMGWYYASKHALETYSDSLRLELKPFGVKVIIIEPGGTSTNWQQVENEHMLKATPKDSVYRPLVQAFANLSSSQAGAESRIFVSPERVAQLIYKVTTLKHPKTRYQVTLIDKLAVHLFRQLPYRALDAMINLAVKAAGHQAQETDASVSTK
ncbi:short chain dehydrogenase [Lactobacillus selangorensis]|uniref:Short chain dehydrogenase n=1 Tax=Lactobacillus selangorensis TaxID=81857 RepID=A0A0R2FWN9_9LACO|nr:oxidoreductase [Lactobacillus selangorensis]KRN28868.1 short chain dehydrogenase [Lactobacillus selangorensis]KRN32722.1 short chain dehydrogenase [Lactobacillus selangorensis]